MKIHSLAKFTSSDRIDAFHYDMFHGREIGEMEPHDYGGDLSTPLRLLRNTWRIPDVFQPASNLVVSQAARFELEKLRNIALLRVEFAKLISYPYRAGDFTFYDSHQY